jgi:hypothetical protein
MRLWALALALAGGCTARAPVTYLDAYASPDAAPATDAAAALDEGVAVDAAAEPPDAFAAPDAFTEPDAYVAPTFVLGAPFADCNTTCAAMGLGCTGSASVGRDCGVHADLPTCNASGAWIYRHHAGEADACYPSWGTCDACTLNYNTDNAFCCRCE